MRLSLVLRALFLFLYATTADASPDSLFEDAIRGGISPEAGSPAAISTVLIGECSGTLIAPDLVLTASHCVTHKNEVKAVHLRGGERHKVLAIQANPDWSGADEDTDGDIALLLISPDLKGTPARLLEDPRVLVKGATVTIAGFGATKPVDDGHDGFGTLRSTTVKIDEIYQSHIETDESHGHTNCNGDSGGSAFIEVNGVTYLWGVVSGGDLKCREIGEYVRVDAYRAWIDATAKALRAR